MDPSNGTDWRFAESRRMIEDARALVSIAAGLAGDPSGRRPVTPEVARPSAPAFVPVPAVLIHAVSIDAEGIRLQPPGGPMSDVPILVLLGEAAALPQFLPDGMASDVGSLTEQAVRTAVEAQVREALGRGPDAHHLVDLVESIQDAVIVIDRQQTVVYLNTSATALLQTLTRRTGPFVGQSLGVAFPPALSATTRPAILDALIHADASRVEDPERHRGMALDIAIFPHPNGATLLVRDATLRRDVEAELIETRLSLARAESRLRARDDEVRS